ncbi:MAG TPA: DUF6504 family protein [Brevefilum fermentans]|jgi:hypothetical protein|uniref:DUF6504 family protein n=1 Tax=Candidatus Brevifilum fermentans TaxID=1986204 RepID=UPI0009CAC34B|nr:DUF6504 family protein [Brevefilum fermentans]MDI9566302.1 DUF6504 family protein [Chloroflexota bacterium]OQB83697.1 MAG: hypothetical protein BWX85_01185 [Chloroflexi bacterium ADurb.Bin120]HOM67729.1 DUF6504 family protein [Brevefilum fermentans]HPX96247.1 DUF6504 family protein [Brevefilum fermentans]HQA29314.1 DUF6504 family protein [Brevefilum fermentans]
MKTLFKNFFSEPITVHFSSPPAFIKKPPCPEKFTWRNNEFIITACLAEWTNFSRRGRMENNMQPEHAQTASQRGSWGVGRYYFDVRTANNRCFRVYYDRAPGDVANRAGAWILMAELIPPEERDD